VSLPPLASPPVAAALIAVDDELEPLDSLLILRLRIELTASPVKSH
jgi:hypothetical protein